MLSFGVYMNASRYSFPSFVPTRTSAFTLSSSSVSLVPIFVASVPKKPTCTIKRISCLAESGKPDQNPDSNPNSKPKPKPARKTRARTPKNPEKEAQNSKSPFAIPKKPRRGRRGEAAAVEDFVRGSLERTLESIGKQNPEILKNVENAIKEKLDGNSRSVKNESDSDEDEDEEVLGDSGEKEMVVDEEDRDWPLDAEVGWGIRASEYFDKHSIKNVVGEDGAEINWEGEIEDGLVKEINCLEWERFAFHPSPLIVLVFERYNRASDNWKVLKELEKAAEVYWKAKDRLPPRTIKIDINIERDLAYALKVKECPQILFFRGNKILYREKDFRSADELVQMIAHFYYNAKKPSCVNDAYLSSRK
ncbi:thioredoxin family protein [Striga asiatica]|uniref:Thioredoxin family protein n=1 Tax=Striga asiatica TaxID=4170 RepID=A0A5A7NWQ5_STRAF|nr:thioredoxin family protein [Striga asiatica]